MLACAALANLSVAVSPADLPCMTGGFEAEARGFSAEAGRAQTAEDLALLAAHAERISDALYQSEGTGNLACIFAGFAEQARGRSKALADADTRRERRRALRAARVVLADAASLGQVAAWIVDATPQQQFAANDAATQTR